MHATFEQGVQIAVMLLIPALGLYALGMDWLEGRGHDRELGN